MRPEGPYSCEVGELCLLGTVFFEDQNLSTLSHGGPAAVSVTASGPGCLMACSQSLGEDPTRGKRIPFTSSAAFHVA